MAAASSTAYTTSALGSGGGGGLTNAGISPFRVLGIALVIDQLGREPTMAFRYPTSLHSGTCPPDATTATSTATSSAPERARLSPDRHVQPGLRVVRSLRRMPIWTRVNRLSVTGAPVVAPRTDFNAA